MGVAVNSTTSKTRRSADDARAEQIRRDQQTARTQEKKKTETQPAAASPGQTQTQPQAQQVQPTQQTREDARLRAGQNASVTYLKAVTSGQVGAPAAQRDSNTNFTQAGDGFLVQRGQVADKKIKDPPPSDIIRNPADVNNPTPEETAAATRALEANREAEQKKLATLPEDARNDYNAVGTTIEGDPVARQSLQDMLLKGRFDTTEGQETLNELEKSTTQKKAAGIEQKELVADMVQEIHDPSAIAQHGYGTCAATTASIHLARTNPSEYVRLANGLAGESGEVKLANGDTIRREDGTIDEDKSNPGATRSQSERLMSAAFMEYAREGADYDPIQDRHENHLGPFEIDRGAGLDNGAYDHLIEGITGKSYDSHDVDDAGAELNRMQAATGRGEDVAVGIQWNADSSHKVLVTKVDDTHVYYTNPWGQEERMTRDEMQRRLLNATYQA